MRVEPRDRVLEATVACAGRVGIERITVEEVARDAGVSRATVYRWFPGGREQLIEEGVTWEVGRFLSRLARAVEHAPDLATRLELGLAFARRAFERHEVLQRLLATEPGGLLPQLQATVPLALAVLRDYVADLLRGERLRPGVDLDEAAEFLARTFASVFTSPGSVDLDDPGVVRDLVRGRMLAGILATSPLT
ncbi:MAG: TetR/AcrR family transcriptional regulator [Acidimicrobiales bacterium]